MKAASRFFVHGFHLIVLVLTNVRRRLVLVMMLVMALFGCAPTIYVEPANTIPFEQMVTLDATIGARVEAHNLAGLVRGDAPSKSAGYLEPMRPPGAGKPAGPEQWMIHCSLTARQR
jgi:hypothetical protein